MKLIRYLFLVSLFMVFIPNVSAASFSVSANADNTNVALNSLVSVNINLTADKIIGECLFSYEADDNIEFVSVTGVNNLVVFSGASKVISLSNSNTEDNIFSEGLDVMQFNFKVNGAGKVVFKSSGMIGNNVLGCADWSGNSYEDENVEINFSIKQNNPVVETPPNDNYDGDMGIEIADSFEVKDIILSEGDIVFSKDVYEYSVTVSDFEKLKVSLDIEGSAGSYTINKEISETNNRVLISILDNEGNTTNYIINVEEINEPIGDDTPIVEEEKFNFVPIFIGIIAILVLINVFRIIKKLKK